MKVEKKLDKIINILYDPILLHWKEVSIADISALGIIKFNINWSDPEVSFILSILENDGYVIINNKIWYTKDSMINLLIKYLLSNEFKK